VVKTVVTVDKDKKVKKKKAEVKKSFCVFDFAKGNRESAQTKYLSGS
jgi:hypothetical protein